MRVPDPGLDKYAIFLLVFEVLVVVVDNYHLRQVSAEAIQILHKIALLVDCVHSVKAVADAATRIDLVNHAVRVLLDAGCENHQLVIRLQVQEEVVQVGPFPEAVVLLGIVPERLVQVEDESVGFLRLVVCGKIGDFHFLCRVRCERIGGQFLAVLALLQDRAVINIIIELLVDVFENGLFLLHLLVDGQEHGVEYKLLGLLD